MFQYICNLFESLTDRLYPVKNTDVVTTSIDFDPLGAYISEVSFLISPYVVNLHCYLEYIFLNNCKLIISILVLTFYTVGCNNLKCSKAFNEGIRNEIALLFKEFKK